jgi:hypothetical protein
LPQCDGCSFRAHWTDRHGNFGIGLHNKRDPDLDSVPQVPRPRGAVSTACQQYRPAATVTDHRGDDVIGMADKWIPDRRTGQHIPPKQAVVIPAEHRNGPAVGGPDGEGIPPLEVGERQLQIAS